MHFLVERSIQQYKLTKGPLRCLAPCDPCGHKAEGSTPTCPPIKVSDSKTRETN